MKLFRIIESLVKHAKENNDYNPNVTAVLVDGEKLIVVNKEETDESSDQNNVTESTNSGMEAGQN